MWRFLILWYNFKGKVLDVTSDNKGHWIFLVVEFHSYIFLLGNIYGYNSDSLNVILGGDFNMNHLMNFSNRLNLLDIWRRRLKLNVKNVKSFPYMQPLLLKCIISL
uniref:Endonuclease/exonuclease/phosphatase domain-containing protein n=1 Tax=Poecilia latipinna TaxID=48699 RepID=A0A3B3V0X9_9TELE